MKDKTGLKTIVCLVNLGSIDSLSLKDIRFFLAQFLSDRRVVNLPKLLWYPILYLIILPFRAKKLQHKYQSIALDEKKYPHFSPLIAYSINLCKKLNNAKDQKCQKHFDYALTYAAKKSNHSIRAIFHQYKNEYDRLLIIPLYPHFSTTTTSAVSDQLMLLKRENPKSYQKIEFVKSYSLTSIFVDTITNQIKSKINLTDDDWHILFSYHSIPQKIVDDGDSYPIECMKSTHLIVSKLGIDTKRIHLSYQSRFGKAKWLEPATDKTILNLAKKGVKKLAVICPGFSMDCLETLEEINMEAREIFLNNAVSSAKFEFIDCLNDSDEHLDMIKKISTCKLKRCMFKNQTSI